MATVNNETEIRELLIKIRNYQPEAADDPLCFRNQINRLEELLNDVFYDADSNLRKLKAYQVILKEQHGYNWV